LTRLTIRMYTPGCGVYSASYRATIRLAGATPDINSDLVGAAIAHKHNLAFSEKET